MRRPPGPHNHAAIPKIKPRKNKTKMTASLVEVNQTKNTKKVFTKNKKINESKNTKKVVNDEDILKIIKALASKK